MGISRLAGPFARDRYRMGAMHLALTALPGLALFALVFFVWYPMGLFVSGRGAELVLLTVGISVAAGPLLTLIVFAPGKKGLEVDLATVLALQLLAFAYGVYVLHLSRPVYVVMVLDRFELVRANEVLGAGASGTGEVPALSLNGPSIVGARVPTEKRELDRMFDAAMAGIDLHHFPQHFVPYDQVRAMALRAAKPIGLLRQLNPASGAQIDRWVAGSGRPEGGLAFLPLRDGGRELAAIVDVGSAELLRVVSLNPWEK